MDAGPIRAMRAGIKKALQRTLLSMRAGLSSWAADFGLVGLKNLYVFFKRVAGAWNKKSTEFISAFLIWWVVVGSS